MSKLLNDELNVRILQYICQGKGISVNINYLADKYEKHRNTISSKVSKIFDSKILDLPLFPLNQLYISFPLMVFEKIELPRIPKVTDWIEKDSRILAAFFIKDEEYNTFLIEFHEDLYDYVSWKEDLYNNKALNIRGHLDRFHKESFYVSTKNIIKNNSASSTSILKENFINGIHEKIKDFDLDELSLDIIESLSNGEAININYNHLSNELGVHRKTIQRRIELMQSEKVILTPICRFPRIWTPPEYFLILSLFEIKSSDQKIITSLAQDPHVPLIAKISEFHYNLLIMSNFYKMADYLVWISQLEERFPNSIGAVKNLFLSSDMTFSIDQYYVAMLYLNKRQEVNHGRNLMKELM